MRVMNWILIALALAMLVSGAMAADYGPIKTRAGANITLNETSYLKEASSSADSYFGEYTLGYSKHAKYILASESVDAAAKMTTLYAAGEKYIKLEPGFNYTMATKLIVPYYCGLDGVIPANIEKIWPVFNLQDGIHTTLLFTNASDYGIEPQQGSTLRNFVCYYPLQTVNTVANITAYPWTIYAPSGSTDLKIENVVGINPYDFIYLYDGDRAELKDVTGYPLHIGIQTVATLGELRLENPCFIPLGFPNYIGPNLQAWIQKYGTGIYIGGGADTTITDYANNGYKYGLMLKDSGGTRVRGLWIEGSLYPLYMDGCSRNFIEHATLASYSIYPNYFPYEYPAVTMVDCNMTEITHSEITYTSSTGISISGAGALNYRNAISNMDIFYYALNTSNPAYAPAIALTGYNNTVSDCKIDGDLASKSAGIVDTGQGTQIKDTTIQDVAAAAYGIYADTSAKDFVYDSNVLNNAGASGYYIASSTGRFSITNGAVHGSTNAVYDGSGAVPKLIRNVRGFNPIPTAPAVPESGVGYTNHFGYDCSVYIYGGTFTLVAVNGITLGGADPRLTVVVPVEGIIAIAYSSVPAWTWTRAE